MNIINLFIPFHQTNVHSHSLWKDAHQMYNVKNRHCKFWLKEWHMFLVFSSYYSYICQYSANYLAKLRKNIVDVAFLCVSDMCFCDCLKRIFIYDDQLLLLLSILFLHADQELEHVYAHNIPEYLYCWTKSTFCSPNLMFTLVEASHYFI